ncbi:MAG: energy transducer TonB [Terricaulis sp.]
MTQTLRMRATSLGASTLVVGLLLAAAFTATTQVWLMSPLGEDAPTIMIERPPPPVIPPVTPPKPQDPPPTRAIIRSGPISRPVIDEFEDFATDLISTSASGVGEGPVVVTSPYWTRRPDNLARYYPRRALERGIEGVVMLDCVVRISGTLDCTPVSETPANWGFADAALRISREHVMTPAMRNGLPAEGRYRMRVPFDLN